MRMHVQKQGESEKIPVCQGEINQEKIARQWKKKLTADVQMHSCRKPYLSSNMTHFVESKWQNQTQMIMKKGGEAYIKLQRHKHAAKEMRDRKAPTQKQNKQKPNTNSVSALSSWPTEKTPSCVHLHEAKDEKQQKMA